MNLTHKKLVAFVCGLLCLTGCEDHRRANVAEELTERYYSLVDECSDAEAFAEQLRALKAGVTAVDDEFEKLPGTDFNHLPEDKTELRIVGRQYSYGKLGDRFSENLDFLVNVLNKDIDSSSFKSLYRSAQHHWADFNFDELQKCAESGLILCVKRNVTKEPVVRRSYFSSTRYKFGQSPSFEYEPGFIKMVVAVWDVQKQEFVFKRTVRKSSPDRISFQYNTNTSESQQLAQAKSKLISDLQQQCSSELPKVIKEIQPEIKWKKLEIPGRSPDFEYLGT